MQKAQRKSYKELYSILISANEMETNAEWDFEMLMLYAALEDWEKLNAESEIFCATYKGSPYIEKSKQTKRPVVRYCSGNLLLSGTGSAG